MEFDPTLDPPESPQQALERQRSALMVVFEGYEFTMHWKNLSLPQLAALAVYLDVYVRERMRPARKEDPHAGNNP